MARLSECVGWESLEYQLVPCKFYGCCDRLDYVYSYMVSATIRKLHLAKAAKVTQCKHLGRWHSALRFNLRWRLERLYVMGRIEKSRESGGGLFT